MKKNPPSAKTLSSSLSALSLFVVKSFFLKAGDAGQMARWLCQNTLFQ